MHQVCPATCGICQSDSVVPYTPPSTDAGCVSTVNVGGQPLCPPGLSVLRSGKCCPPACEDKLDDCQQHAQRCVHEVSRTTASKSQKFGNNRVVCLGIPAVYVREMPVDLRRLRQGTTLDCGPTRRLCARDYWRQEDLWCRQQAHLPIRLRRAAFGQMLSLCRTQAAVLRERRARVVSCVRSCIPGVLSDSRGTELSNKVLVFN